MSDSSEDLTIKLKSKKADCNESEIGMAGMGSHANEISSNIGKHCASDENGKESFQSSDDESTKATRIDSPEQNENTNSNDGPEKNCSKIGQNSNFSSKDSENKEKLISCDSHTNTTEDNKSDSHEKSNSQKELSDGTNNDDENTIHAVDKGDNIVDTDIVSDTVNKDIISKSDDKKETGDANLGEHSDNVDTEGITVENNDTIKNKESSENTGIHEDDVMNIDQTEEADISKNEDAGSSENKVDITSESKNTETSESKDTETSENKDTEISENKDTEVSENKDTDASKSKDTGTSESKDTQASKSKDTDASESKDTEASKSKDTEASKSKDIEASESKDTEARESKDTEASENKDTEASENKDTEDSEIKDDDAIENMDDDATENKDSGAEDDVPNSPMECDADKATDNINGENDTESTVSAMEGGNDVAQQKNNLNKNSSLNESMDVDSNSLNSTDAGASTESMGATELSSKDESALKIKLRSFASLCDGDEEKKPNEANAGKLSPEVEGVSFGDIVQHSNIVEPDESGVLHLKISDVVGKEECITGLLEDDTLSSLQITSVVSLTEPLSPEEPQDGSGSQLRIASVGTVSDPSFAAMAAKDKKAQMVIFHKNRLVVETVCIACRKPAVCKYRIVYRPAKPYIKCPYLCSDECRDNFVSLLPKNHRVEKATRFFERLCSMCDNTLLPKDIVHWQTREFCNKLCLADHIGEVAKQCNECKTAVKVLFMGKYCVRFGSEVHQFCSHHCLESYKIKFDSCSYCQKNLENTDKVISEPPKKYCSMMCMRRAQREDIGQMNYSTQNCCTVCQKVKINQYEFMNNNETVLLCSNPCLSVYKYVNQAKAVNCCMCARFVNAEDFPNYFYTNNQLRVFCSDSCLSVFIITARRVVSCQYCKVKKYNFDMIQKSCLDNFYCSICCLNLMDTDRGKQMIETVQLETATPKSSDQEPILKICQMCNKHLPAQFHMVMSDSTLRSFCSYNCACKFKSSFGYQVSGINVPSKGDAVGTAELSVQTPNNTVAKKTSNQQASAGKVDFQALANILKEFEPPEMINKWTTCKPNKTTIAVQCAPTMRNKAIQTDDDGKPPFVPVPFPTFVPTPMMMYSANVPIPLILPIPVPVPVFIPTTEKTTEDIIKRMNKIQNEIPDDPIQAELLLLAKGQEAEMQQELEAQITEEDLQTPQMVLEEPDEILTFVDNDEDLSLLDESIFKFPCEAETGVEPKKGKKKRRSCDDDMPPSKKQKTSEVNTDDTLNASYGLSVWIDWVRKKNVELKEKFNGSLINEDLVQINSEAINECLSMFITDLQQNEDRIYEIDTIFYLMLGIQKVMFERGSTFCIFLEDRFEKFRGTFDKMISSYLRRRFNSEILGFQMLNGSRVTEDMLWQCRQLGAHTPYVLLNTLFYFSTKCFRLRTVEDHMALSFSQVIKQWRRACIVEGSYTRTTLLKYFPRQAHFDKTELEMHENRVDPLKCPVKLYEFYLSKCPESVRSQQGLYYIYPETCCMPDSPVWFSTGALNAVTIERMLNRVQLVKEIQEALYH